MIGKEATSFDPRLDSLRAISALAIIPFHWGILPIGWVGVQVFFVLSGMLITESLLRSKSRISSLRDYLVYFLEKRILRLFPLYYGFLIILTIIFLLTHWPKTFGSEAVYLFTYTLNLIRMVPGHSFPSPYGHLWSLGVEWQFYLLWPLFVWRLSWPALTRLMLALVIFAPFLRETTLCVAGMFTNDPLEISSICYRSPWSHWDALALGGLLAHTQARAFLAKTWVWVTILTVTALAGALVVHFGAGKVADSSLGFSVPLSYFDESVWGYSLVDLSAACLIALTVGASRLTAFTNLGFLQYLGKISYGIYVFHLPLLYWGADLLNSPHRFSVKAFVFLAAIIALDLLLAHLSYQYYESWFLRKKAQLREQAA